MRGQTALSWQGGISTPVASPRTRVSPVDLTKAFPPMDPDQRSLRAPLGTHDR